MKQKKPFKLGAIYKLKDNCISLYQFTDVSRSQCFKYHGRSDMAFTMRVTQTHDYGCKGVLVEADGSDTPFSVLHSERDFFTRVDNK